MVSTLDSEKRIQILIVYWEDDPRKHIGEWRVNQGREVKTADERHMSSQLSLRATGITACLGSLRDNIDLYCPYIEYALELLQTRYIHPLTLHTLLVEGCIFLY